MYRRESQLCYMLNNEVVHPGEDRKINLDTESVQLY